MNKFEPYIGACVYAVIAWGIIELISVEAAVIAIAGIIGFLVRTFRNDLETVFDLTVQE